MQNVENDENSSSSTRWVYAPLVTFAIISSTPSLLFLLSWLLVWSNQFEAKQALSGTGEIMLASAIGNWPFLALYFITRINEFVELDITSLRYAMRSLLVVMAIPNLIPLIASVALEPPNQRIDEIGYAMVLQAFILPILGVGGWFFGRWSSPKSP
jgi:hypothetical protein